MAKKQIGMKGIKGTAGRPTKLTKGLLDRLEQEFLPWAGQQTMLKTVMTARGPMSLKIPRPPTQYMMQKWIEEKFRKDPIIQGKIIDETFNEWTKGNSEDERRFTAIVKELRKMYEEILVENALTETYPARFAQFILSAKHDYREKSDVTSNDNEIGVILYPTKE